MWCVPELNEEYVSRMEDLLELYERPQNPSEPVLCLDEKPVPLHAEVRPASPAKPGREARRDSEYSRCGTANIFCAVEPKAGRHFSYPTPNRSAVEFSKVIVDLALQYPAARTIHLVLDNLNIHRRKSLTDLLGDQVGGEIWGRFTVHYTPVHGSCQGLEPPNKSESNPNQLELHATESPRQVRLQKEVFQAVKALDNRPAWRLYVDNTAM
jgi:hypothetical protein